VLDDQGPCDPLPGPSWYLGRHRPGGFADSIHDLLERTIRELGLDRERVATVGSSMGGWAALYFCARLRAGLAIAGEPQTLLGRYLCGPPLEPLAEHVIGSSSPQARASLDAILFDALHESGPSMIHLYCGNQSDHHVRHVRPLAEFLDELGRPYEIELGHDFPHEELAEHVPAYLTSRLEEMLATPAARS
jgi:pimeloyl-ACP methyl ester carboxylesterase